MEQYFKIIKKEKTEFEPFELEVCGKIVVTEPEMALALFGVFNRVGCFDFDNIIVELEYREFLKSMNLEPEGIIDTYWVSYCEEGKMDPKTGKKIGVDQK